MIQPFFSVIIPTFNRQKLVVQAIRSVLSQSYPSFEILVVDDASGDGTKDEILGLKEKRIRYILNDRNRGPAYSRNVGIGCAKGNLISFLDSDDELHPGFLGETALKFESVGPEVGFVWAGVRFRDRETGKILLADGVWKPHRRETPYKTFLHGLYIGSGCGVTIKKEVFEKAGLFDETLEAAEDTEFFLRASRHFDFDYIDKPLIDVFKDNQDRISRDFKKTEKAYQKILLTNRLEIDKDKVLRLKYNYKLQWLSYHTKNRRNARRFFKSVISDSPFHLKSWVNFLLFELLGYKIGRRLHLRISEGL